MTRATSRIFLVLAAASASLSACGVPEDGAGTTNQGAAIISGTPTSDPIGYAYYQNSFSFCSGTMLTPQWVLTAGHCFVDDDGISRLTPFGGNAILGTTTLQVRNNVNQGFVHPKWWDPATSTLVKDSAYDVGLLRIATPFATAGYSNFLVNELSNRSPTNGEGLTCYGYGYTNTSETAGGTPGGLQKASLTIANASATINSFVKVVNRVQQTAPMINLAGNSQGQQIYHGDSGGSCADPNAVNQIVGINDMVDTSANPYGSYIVPVANVRPWIEQTMHPGPTSLGQPPSGRPSYTTALSSPSNNGNSIYVIGAYTGARATNRLYMRAYSDKSSWSSWSPLSVTGLPSSGIASRVAVAATSFSPGYVQLVLAVIGGDHQMYTASLVPGPGPNSSWTSMTWSAAGTPSGKQFLGGTHPAIGFIGGRMDVFGIGSDSKIYERWQTGFGSTTWNNAWTLVPSSMTFSKGVSVAYWQGSYLLVGLSDQSASNPNSGGAAWIAVLSSVTGTNYGNWSGWSSLGGYFTGPPAITAWLGGVRIYGLSSDNNLYVGTHNLHDPITMWSGWIPLSKGTFVQPEGVSANTSWEQAGQIDIVTTDSTTTPVLMAYPM